jgi:DNA-binding transcriptional regulator YiaG
MNPTPTPTKVEVSVADLKAYRLKHALNQPRAAEACGVSLSLWKQWESGRRTALLPEGLIEAAPVLTTVAPVTPAEVLQFRQVLEMTVVAVAKALRVSDDAWREWESGRTQLSRPKFEDFKRRSVLGFIPDLPPKSELTWTPLQEAQAARELATPVTYDASNDKDMRAFHEEQRQNRVQAQARINARLEESRRALAEG